MKKLLYLVLVLLCATSCFPSYTTKLVYTGRVTYYFPNGETESYDASYIESYDGGVKQEALNVDYGNGNRYIFHDIPYAFKGHLMPGDSKTVATSNAANFNNEVIILNTEAKDGFLDCSYNGAQYKIPVRTYYELKYRSNGDAKTLNKLLIEYLNK